MMSEEAGTPKERGRRLRKTRDALGFSRSLFSSKHDITPSSLQNWEQGRYGGLTEKGAKKLVSAFRNSGIDCTLEWLLYGIGSNPLTDKLKTRPIAEIIQEELDLFYDLNPNAIDFLIPDNAMAPRFAIGDLVAGSRYFDKQISKAIGLDCIVETTDGNVMVRQLEIGDKPGYYSLVATNHPVIENVQLLTAAPIVWIRRKI